MARAGGALALVSGRAIADLDRLFAPLRLKAAGVHGAELRLDPDDETLTAEDADPLPHGLWTELHALLRDFPGTFVENKRFSFAVHYRQSPDVGDALRSRLADLLEALPHPGITMLEAHCAFELKTTAFDKGRAIAAFLDDRRFRAARRSSSATTTPTKRVSPRSPRIGGRGYSVGRRRPDAIGRVRRARTRCATGSPRSLAAAPRHERSGPGAASAARSRADRQQLRRRFVDRQARLVWWCFPRFDSDPVFSRLLTGDEEKGFCDVVLHGQKSVESRYVRNTAIVETILTADDGASLRVTDFAPRFDRFERAVPAAADRSPDRAAGRPAADRDPRAADPRLRPPDRDRRRRLEPHPLRRRADVMRLTSDAPLSYIINEITFPLTRPMSLVFGQDEPFLTAIDATSREFLEHTRDHWLDWSRNLAVPFEWQSEVVRAAITLKNCAFMETGAIVAAHTTSIPEAPRSGRNWDYRFCWLRDAYFVVDALNRLGATQTMESYIHYITTIAIESGPMRPLHGIVPFSPLNEWIAPDLAGFMGQGPVRVGNQAAAQTQNDVYGSVVLAAAQMFVDERLPAMGDEPLFHMLETLGEKALAAAFEPDAGLWEYRTRERPHTYSATLCWAACDRLARIARMLGLERAAYWKTQRRQPARENPGRSLGRVAGRADRRLRRAGARRERPARRQARPRAAERSAVRQDLRGDRADADAQGADHALHRAGRFRAARDRLPRLQLLVHRRPRLDRPLGRRARAVRGDPRSRNVFGLLSEDIHPETGQLWGNLPQTYSMAGIINSATRLSSSWEEAWARA